ncbi:mercuric reductase [Mannheimia granulomatis]|uniref:Mercuric reductase n=1 Tax=Mannheimia granulomatis TaxID=85402 RepID=A0A6G8JKT3_9PAST|nr:heavy-metal-associated domain-containing protein [Mannheimia granulomatis]QIM67770.1 mercuric reductase [Mannheimia granulomatis]
MKAFFVVICMVLCAFQTTYAEEKYSTEISKQAEKTITLHIEEMNCQLCVYLVNKELRAIKGVVSTKASMKDRNVRVIVNENLDPKVLIQAVEKLHYSAKVI